MLNELLKLQYNLEHLSKQKDNLDKCIIDYNNEVTDLNEQLNDLIIEKGFYKKAVDIVYERSIEELKNILNTALSTIFIDREYAVDIVLTDKRGKSLQLKATENGKPVNLKRGTPMGVRTVISAILQIYYLQCKDSKILMLDEAYSAVSKEYVEAFFNFLSQLCQNLGFRIILITHDPRFLQYADKKYKIEQGVVTSV